jgi:uncharacterized RDD family membrane protein YckC
MDARRAALAAGQTGRFARMHREMDASTAFSPCTPASCTVNVCARGQAGKQTQIAAQPAAFEGTLELSTAGHPHLEPAWKQEVNRRLAAHKSRRAGASNADTQERTAAAANSRAAEAAARVAARYAQAPTYSQMQAEEARVAVRAAEIATKVALEAQAAAESALAGLHAATEQPMRGPAMVESIARTARVEVPQPAAERVPEPPAQAMEEQEIEPLIDVQPEPAMEPVVVVALPPEPTPVITHQMVDGRSFDLRWEPDLPVPAKERKPAPPRPREEFGLAPEDWWTPAEMSESLCSEPFHVEAQFTHANLIEFPRELVATRKMRPRLAEAIAAAEADPQLSIFEVDPGGISTEPEPISPAHEPQAGAFSAPDWSGIELDAHPIAGEELEPETASAAQGPPIAPFGLRVMAAVVDGALIVGAFFAAAAWTSAHMQHVPVAKTAEAMAVAGLLLAGLAYHALFFGLGRMTPGMKYAGIALSTFDDEVPNRVQLRRRFGAMVLSLLPVGLGFVWSVFDEDRLSWHDRISGTYPRKR